MNWMTLNIIFYASLGIAIFFGIKGSISNVKRKTR